jgi:hypothetical protein
MIISKRLIICIASAAIILASVIVLFWRLDIGDNDDAAKHVAECGLLSANGEIFTIRQGTVGRVFGISIGLESVKDGKANIRLWSPDANVLGPTLTLGSCGSADFNEYTIFVLAVKDRLENPFGGSGSGSDSVEVFVKKH